MKSYRQLPQTLYQIQVKFRDEFRPRFGLMRAREFIMKDAYSFHTDGDSLHETYEVMGNAYTRILERCGLDSVKVEAEAGAIGGDVNHEFIVLADAGESEIFRCDNCGYAANDEKAESAGAKRDTEAAQEANRNAIRFDPERFVAQLNLGRLLLDADRPDEAVPHLERAAELSPQHPQVQSLLRRARAARDEQP